MYNLTPKPYLHEAEQVVLLSKVTLTWLILFGGHYFNAFSFGFASDGGLRSSRKVEYDEIAPASMKAVGFGSHETINTGEKITT